MGVLSRPACSRLASAAARHSSDQRITNYKRQWNDEANGRMAMVVVTAGDGDDDDDDDDDDDNDCNDDDGDDDDDAYNNNNNHY
ncbi:hypothetical protein E2C01_095825 [Portunus trituberculatus]|uniref:Uncharacterized protein n=1 Tax=Portunus trituberculatus TaxID=210409 RepID=A0A5B7K5A5_PORTR|nr:hypothetical protein [Portunus trituberculatus]